MSVTRKPGEHGHPTAAKLDERVAVPLDPEEAIRAFLKVDPDSQPVLDQPEKVSGPTTTTA